MSWLNQHLWDFQMEWQFQMEWWLRVVSSHSDLRYNQDHRHKWRSQLLIPYIDHCHCTSHQGNCWWWPHSLFLWTHSYSCNCGLHPHPGRHNRCITHRKLMMPQKHHKPCNSLHSCRGWDHTRLSPSHNRLPQTLLHTDTRTDQVQCCYMLHHSHMEWYAHRGQDLTNTVNTNHNHTCITESESPEQFLPVAQLSPV